IDEGDKNRWQFRIINSVTINVDEKWTRVIWEKALEDNTPKSNPQVHVFRRRVAPFGHNAPMWVTMPLSFKQTYPNSSNGTAEEWPFFNLSDSENEVYLDSVYPDIVPHTDKKASWLVLSGLHNPSVFQVTKVTQRSREHFAMSARVMRLTLDGDGWDDYNLPANHRLTTVYAASERLSFAKEPTTGSIGVNYIDLDRQIDGMLPGRRVILTGRAPNSSQDQVELLTLESVTLEQSAFSRFSFKEAIAHTNDSATVSVYANVARATHGETVHQILGSGAARQTHQRFTLKHAPLTFVGAANEIGAEAALEVRVNDIRW